ncbi:MAG: glycoside hydrolase family 88 protein [Bacteroides sp.]|nr:glycoside hydrolase family 88 protein [Bacteroides sp.]MCM1421851.1 glycoside hydrolase family 88 protein [Bacteroides sp.]
MATSSLLAEAQNVLGRNDILSAMEKANDYFLAKYPDAGAPTFVKKMRPSNLWTRGVYFEGLSALMDLENQLAESGKNANDEAESRKRKDKFNQYYKYINDWGTAHQWTPRNGVTTRDADDYCCSQTYLDIYMLHNEQTPSGENDKYLLPTVECMRNLMNNDATIGDWTWIDAIQMGLPVWAKLARISHLKGNDSEAAKYMERGWKMYAYSRNDLAGGLWNAEDGLWWRDKDFVAPYREPNGEDCYWSRGNGWVYAALVRTMDAMMIGKKSQTYTESLDEKKWKKIKAMSANYKDYEADFKAMSKALLNCQREDRFWNVSLHDGSNFGGKELTGTALFIYGMAWGVRHGILPRGKYLPVIASTWNTMVKECLHDNGFLGYVQGTGKEPKDSQPVGYSNEPDFDDFGLGCFLLAGYEVYKLL